MVWFPLPVHQSSSSSTPFPTLVWSVFNLQTCYCASSGNVIVVSVNISPMNRMLSFFSCVYQSFGFGYPLLWVTISFCPFSYKLFVLLLIYKSLNLFLIWVQVICLMYVLWIFSPGMCLVLLFSYDVFFWLFIEGI